MDIYASVCKMVEVLNFNGCFKNKQTVPSHKNRSFFSHPKNNKSVLVSELDDPV